jgi:hypothetical protein
MKIKKRNLNRNGRKVRKGAWGEIDFAFPISATTRDASDHGDHPITGSPDL